MAYRNNMVKNTLWTSVTSFCRSIPCSSSLRTSVTLMPAIYSMVRTLFDESLS